MIYYIATTGNDTTGAGTLASPWLTISKAFNSSTNGDTINVAAGTYTWLDQNFTSGRIVTGPAIVRGSQLPTAIFDAAGLDKYWRFDNNTFVFNNLMLQNFVNADNATSTLWSNGASNVTWNDCVFRNGTMTSTNQSICLFGANGGGAVLTLNRCVLYGMNSTSGNTGYWGNTGWEYVTTTINGCIFYCTSPTPVSVTSRAGSAGYIITAKNSIFYTAIACGWHYSSTAFTWSGGATNLNFGYSSAPAGAAITVTTDPLFVDASAGNFNLRPGSPAWGMGTTL